MEIIKDNKFIKKKRINSYKIHKLNKFDVFVGKRQHLDLNGNSVYFIVVEVDGINITNLLKGKQVLGRVYNNYGTSNGLKGIDDIDFINFIINTLKYEY